MQNLTLLQNFPSNDKAEQVTDFLVNNFAQIIDQFDCNTKTRTKYKSDAKMFISFVSEAGLNLNTFRAFKKHLEGITDISTKTKALKLTAAKRLLQELKDRYQLLAVDLTSGTKGFQVSAEHVKDGLTKAEVKKVKAVITEEADTMKRTRMIALYSLLALQGLRQFEAVALTVEDLRLNDRIAFVKGKGRDDKERIDLHPETVSALEDYLQTSGKKSGFLFTSISRATKGSTDPLTERAVRKLFAAIFQKAGLPEGRSVHGFRHFFVSQILEVTSGDLLTVQKFSRHKSLQAIKFYDDRKRKAELLPMFYNAFAS